MSEKVSPAEFLDSARSSPILDVRSPGEYLQAHIPGAVNVPLFDDAERARVGKTYKQAGKDAAMKLGLKIVQPKLDGYVEQSRQAAPDGDALVHCWRGGLRSQNFAMLLESAGFTVSLLDGGYQEYRRFAHRCFANPLTMVILSGLTGAGKTKLLHALRERGEQVLDLEALARHRGSAFGAIGQPQQPTVEQFENNLLQAWRMLDSSRLVWVEDEGQSIGRVFIPRPVWTQMSDSPAVFLDVDLAQRTAFLLKEYGTLDSHELAESVTKIKKRLGGARWQQALSLLEAGDLEQLTELLLLYYDKAYYHAQAKRARARTSSWPLSEAADTSNIDDLCRFARTLVGETRIPVAHSPAN